MSETREPQPLSKFVFSLTRVGRSGDEPNSDTFAYEVNVYPSIPRCLYRPDVIQRTFILNSQPRDCDAFTMPKNHFAQHVLHTMYYLIIKPIIVLVLVSYHFWLNLLHQWPMVKILFLELIFCFRSLISLLEV